MLKSYFLSFGLLLGLPCAVSAQTPDSGYPVHSTHSFPTNFSGAGFSSVSLTNGRPNAVVPHLTADTRLSTLTNEVSYTFNANLADSFKQEKSGLLLEPRLTRYGSGDATLRGYSAEIRIGSVNFEQSDFQPRGWYVFAATDGEAISLNASSITGSGNAMTFTLADQITVGDLQAGISTYVADGTQLTFSYIETEASFSARGGVSNSKRESFAGISLSKEF